MNLKIFLSELNIITQCRKYRLSLWQCPQFLFLVMGAIIIVTALLAYAIGNRYVADPEIVALIVIILTLILFIISFVITNSFERLAEANRMKSEFISVISHQLRTPLSNLRWVVELLMSGRLGKIKEKQIEYFRILKENSARMGELVKDLLTVSRIETKTLPLNKEEISLEKIIRELIKEFKPFAQASNVEIKFVSQKKLPKVFIDPSQIKLVLENLLDNAIRYIKEKGKILVKLEKKGEKIYFEIRDNGVGIPKEDQRYIFQKFFRSGNIMKKQTQGSGLGLYIAKSIVVKSGGKIGFKSQEDRGSTFWFTVPIK
jgi:signal transduction histidine kinase